MQQLQNSKIRTEHSFLPVTPPQQRLLLGWIASAAVSAGLPKGVEQASGGGQCLMVRIDSIHHLPFRRVKPSSQVWVQLKAVLISKTGQIVGRTILWRKQLDETNAYTFTLREGPAYYCSIARQFNCLLRVEVLLTEREINAQGGVCFAGRAQNAGILTVDLTKERKGNGKEKKRVVGLGEQEGEQNQPNQATANYLVLKSEAYRLLEKLLPQNTLCSSSDSIPGLLGYFLPPNEASLADLALTPEKQTAFLRITHLQISSLMLRQVISRAELVAKNRFGGAQFMCSVGKLHLRVGFHNGWQCVSTGESLLEEKTELILKTNQSNLSELRAKSPPKIKTQSAGPQFKHYEAEKSIQLALVFPQEEQCAIILQVQAKIQVTGSFQGAQGKTPPPLNQQLRIGVCFALAAARSMSNRQLALKLQPTTAWTNSSKLREFIAQMSQATSTLAPSRQRMGNFQTDNFSMAKTVRTIDNVSIKSTKVAEQCGQMELQVFLRDSGQMGDSQPALQLSRADLRQKIHQQKQRMLREHAKPPPRPTALLCLNPLIAPSLPSFTPTPKPIKKQTILQYLRQQATKVQAQRTYHAPLQPVQKAKPFEPKVYHILQMGQNNQSEVAEQKISGVWQMLRSNGMGEKGAGQYQTTPLELLRTEISEINYNNCYFFNLLSFAPFPGNPTRFPPLFYLRLQFWLLPPIVSPLLTVDKDSGQVEAVKTPQGGAEVKILHVEVEFDGLSDTYQFNFLHFIEYLYNGAVQCEIIDQAGLTFAKFAFPLRSLIRKRRNQAVSIHQQPLLHRHLQRGKVRMQARAIRKLKNKPFLAEVSAIRNDEKSKEKKEKKQKQLKEIKEVDEEKLLQIRQLQRINKFKAGQKSDEGRGGKIGTLMRESQVGRQLLRVSSFKKYFFFIQLNNPKDAPLFLRFSVVDPHHKWIAANPLSRQQQITLVRQPSQLQSEDASFISCIRSHQQKMPLCLSADSQEVCELPAKSRGYLLLCYLSVRSYKPDAVGQELVIHNGQRLISCAATDETNGRVHAVYGIQIQPQPDEPVVEFQYYRPFAQRTAIHLPLLLPEQLLNANDQLLSDDPFVAVKPFKNGRGLAVGLDSSGKQGDCRITRMLLVNSAKQQQLLAESRKTRRLGEQTYLCGPEIIKVEMRTWHCFSFTVTGDLWIATAVPFRLPRSLQASHCFIISDDPDTLHFTTHSSKSDSSFHELIQLNPSPLLHACVTPSKIGLIYIHAHVVDAANLSANSSIQNAPLLRMVIAIQTRPPVLKEVLRIKLSSMGGQVQQPFSYRSSCPKKTEFTVLSSESTLVWAKSSDASFQLQARGERKIVLNIDMRSAAERLTGGWTGNMVVGVRWDRGIDYYGLRFQLPS